MSNKRKIAGKLVGAAMCGAILAGVGAGAALAAPAPAAKAAGAPVTMPMNSVSNLTPYAWTLADTQVGQGPLPPQTVQPGQTASWNGTPPPYTDRPGSTITDYRFTDKDGIKHQVLIQQITPGHTPNSYFAFSEDLGADGAYHDSTQYFQMKNTDGNGPHTDAVWNNATTLKIDGAKDPASAAALVNYELPRANPGSVAWTPNPGATPKFNTADTSRASSMVYNYSSAKATLEKGHETTKGQKTSLGEEITNSISTNIDGVAFSSKQTVSFGQEWGSSDSIGMSVGTEVDPGTAGWLNKIDYSASLTGELDFTAGNITFDITNVEVTKGNIADTGPGMKFQEDDCALGGTDCAAATPEPAGTAKAAKTDARPAAKKTATLSASPGQMVSIDATTDQADAVEALKHYQDATDRSFTPSTTAASFAHSDWKPVQDIHGGNEPAVSGGKKATTGTLDIKHDDSSSWSLGGSIEASVGFDLVGIIDEELSVKFTADHTWESSAADTQSIEVTAEPGKTVWIEASTSTASYTGNFAFTSGGVRYLVNNVTITQPASPAVDAMSNTSYRVMEQPNSSLGLPADTSGGLKAISSLPKLQAYINAGH